MNAGVRILADDVTGALDTGIAFAGFAGALAAWGATPTLGATVHSIDSRDVPRDEAKRRAAACTAWLLAAPHPFKKIDSRLRGHVAAELAALAGGEGSARVVVAPAYPAEGRIMRHGRLLVRDPSGGAERVEPVDLLADLADEGLAARLATAADLIAVSRGILVYDAAEDRDLDTIVTAARAMPGKTVWCGSAGLADALAQSLGIPPAPVRAAVAPVLLVVGTDHASTAAQIAHLRRSWRVPVVPVGAEGEGISDVAASIAAGASILALAVPARVMSREAAAQAVDATLGKLVERVPRPGSVFATGGATLQALARNLGADAVALDGAVASGVPAGRLVGGRWDGLRLMSKSGGFAPPSFFTDLVAAAE